MSNQAVSINLRGVERRKSPTLADEGGASFCHNLRPALSGLELVKNKPLLYSIEGALVQTAAGDSRIEITKVYRHRALPRGYYLVVLNKRDVTLWKEVPEGGTALEQVKGDNLYGGGYPARYDEDIVALGELNNVLVVRTRTRMDYFLWYNGVYSYMPAVAAPKYMSLSQDFDFADTSLMKDDEKKEYAERASKRGRDFFQAVIGFNTEKGLDGFERKYEASLDSCLQFVQGLRAEEEANQRKMGRFVGHVLVRCALKTAQENYVAYGQVLHTEVGSWYGNHRKSNFYASDEAEKSRPWYKRLHAKLIDDDLGADGMLLPDGGKGEAGFYPIPRFNTDGNNAPPVFSIGLAEDELACNGGFSQPPVFVGAFPNGVWRSIYFRGTDDLPGGVRYEYKKKMPVGVYAPSVFYSFPVLRIFISNSSDDGLSMSALRYYSDNNIIQSLCVAMTAPVKHGYGTQLYKVATLTSQEVVGAPFNVSTELSDWAPGATNRGADDMFDVYGYPTNIDVNPDKLSGRNFYIVKDISLSSILEDIERFKKNPLNGPDTVEAGYKGSGYWYKIPLQLKEIGAIEKDDGNGNVVVETSGEAVSDNQDAMLDPNFVSLNNIELAKPLPTDNFTAHKIMGDTLFDYNRRLHLFGTETILFRGDAQSAILQYDTNGFGGNRVVYNAESQELYFEYELHMDDKVVYRRVKIDSYLCLQNNSSKMVLHDFLTYPDYRCKTIRVVQRLNGQWYTSADAQFECENSILNNIAYHANITDKKSELPDIRFSSTTNFTMAREFQRKRNNGEHTWVWCWRNTDIARKDIPTTSALYAYKEDDMVAYKPIVVDIDALTVRLDRPDETEEDIAFDEGNRVQVSETDDVFFFPLKNSYRVGTLDNSFVAVNSMYGQVTEQKFGMFPLYMFTREGIFTLEQGTGDILYQNVSKINDDRLTSPQGLCNAGDMIAYVVRNGLKLIQGKTAQTVSELVRGLPRPITEVHDVTRTADFVDEIQGGYLIYDEYHQDVLMLCPHAGTSGTDVLWAYNTLAKTFYQRGDALNGKRCPDSGVVENEKNLAWSGELSWRAEKFCLSLNVWDYNKADELTERDAGSLRFAYVSNLYRLGMNGYKHMERLVLRAFGNVGALKITLYGSLDGRKCYRIGESKDITEVQDVTLRRSPCSFVYFGFVLEGDALKGGAVPMDEVVLQIGQLDMALRQKYAGRLR